MPCPTTKRRKFRWRSAGKPPSRRRTRPAAGSVTAAGSGMKAGLVARVSHRHGSWHRSGAMLLVADIGGTSTRLALIGPGGPRDVTSRETHASAAVADLAALLDTVIARAPAAVEACSLGVPGPVVEERAEVTNLPWLVDARALSARLGGRPVFLLNDLEA